MFSPTKAEKRKGCTLQPFLRNVSACSGGLSGATEERLEGDQAKASCRPQGFHAVVHLQLVVDVRQVEIHSPLGNNPYVSNLFAAVTLGN